MKKNQQNNMRKLGEILNASSETFMLVALVSLFAIPFVIGANIEPVVKNSENLANRPANAIVRELPDETLNTASSSNSTAQVVSVSPTTPSVLGVTTSNKPFDLSEDKTNMSYFDVSKSELTENKYSLELSTDQIFGKIALLNIKNDSDKMRDYRVFVMNKEDLNLSDKYLYVNDKQYEITSTNIPGNFTLRPGEEAKISLMSNKSRNTNISLALELIEN